MIGIIIGAIPTLSKAACFALDELFRRPVALANAQATAQAGDEAAVGAHLFEALRFNPVNPVIYRRGRRTRLGATDDKEHHGARRQPVVMHDEAVVPSPRVFRTDRPWGQYLLWGRGVHLCFGDHINRARCRR